MHAAGRVRAEQILIRRLERFGLARKHRSQYHTCYVRHCITLCHAVVTRCDKVSVSAGRRTALLMSASLAATETNISVNYELIAYSSVGASVNQESLVFTFEIFRHSNKLVECLQHAAHHS